MTPTPLYQCHNVSFSYRLGNTSFPALRGVELTLDSGELTCLAGPSGSGKSTLLNLLGLIEPVSSGDIRLLGESLAGMSEARKNEVRRSKLGFVFQQFLLFDTLSALENVEYFLKHRPLTRLERRVQAEHALDSVGLHSQRMKRPLEMSGGQRQRVAIARALAKEPKVILADEPTASLDQATGREVMEIFARLVAEEKKTVVFASHDTMAMAFATRLVRLKDGKIEKIEGNAKSNGKTSVRPVLHPHEETHADL